MPKGDHATYKQLTETALASMLAAGDSEFDVDELIHRMNQLAQDQGQVLGRRHGLYVRKSLMREHSRRYLVFQQAEDKVRVNPVGIQHYTTPVSMTPKQRPSKQRTKAEAEQESQARLDILSSIHAYIDAFEKGSELPPADAEHPVPDQPLHSEEIQAIPRKIRLILEHAVRQNHLNTQLYAYMQESQLRFEVIHKIHAYVTAYEKRDDGEVDFDRAESSELSGEITPYDTEMIPSKVRLILEDAIRQNQVTSDIYAYMKALAEQTCQQAA